MEKSIRLFLRVSVDNILVLLWRHSNMLWGSSLKGSSYGTHFGRTRDKKALRRREDGREK